MSHSLNQSLLEQADALLMRMARDHGLPFKTVFDFVVLSDELGFESNQDNLQKIFSYFYKSGWVSAENEPDKQSFERVILRQSGKDRGVLLLNEKGPISVIEKIRRITDRWVGLIALLTLVATVTAALFSYLAIAE